MLKQTKQMTGAIHFTTVNTPLGEMTVGVSEQGICLAEFSDYSQLDTMISGLKKMTGQEIIQQTHSLHDDFSEQLSLYFDGKLKTFTFPLYFPGTEFQRRVWQTLLSIPYGETWSYARQSREMDNPGAVRAVARANGMNRISIIIPCHRVIGSNGTLTGYAGGIWRKEALLALERKYSSI